MVENLISREVFEGFLEALMAGRKAECRKIVAVLMDDKVSPVALYVELFSQALYEIGSRWERGELSVATEHLATCIIEDLLGIVFARQTPLLAGKKAVVFCGLEELHQVGARMVADTLESMGWDVAFLGANTPVADLLDFVARREPDLVAVSVTLERHLEDALRVLENLARQRPHLTLLAGGQAVCRQRHRLAECPGVLVLETLYDLKEVL